MTVKRYADDKAAKGRPRPRGVALVFASAGALCLIVAAAVFALWFTDSLGYDVALEARIARADCLVLDQLLGKPTTEPLKAPRVRFYAPAAGEWIETTLMTALGRHRRHTLPHAWLSFLTRHPPGDEIPCYYDPDDPGAAAALSEHVDALYVRLLACATVVVVLWVIGTISLAIAVADALDCADTCRYSDDDDSDGNDDDNDKCGPSDLETNLPPSRGWASRWRLLDVVLAE
ncbi:hypothetical protein pqer_cds_462 [Pandoravirus quercus]|uniref:Uncharacterized protein n=2 Tax=Pandoravirus TaxID=2060084 RepID=A0A2U7U8W8_9VIRU|nr:hypothetical protein pqer_cds_462 [Pandoravirus quercus]AVK74884.1 hypothetical protein pqer_cds_462 [Pandoravirus quercus]QBZ81070.1 hypothetical protein pclt_cds_475 [Pandoravirus celtis]